MVEKTALKPIAASPLLKAVGFDVSNLPDLPMYELLFDFKFETLKSLIIGLLELEMFKKLLTLIIIIILIL
jgi:hypothetical protein